ncbi:hypothetical protein JCM3774_004627 [Rhodotorula dairenensis]
MRLACGICLSSRSDVRDEATSPDADWVAVTDCGHVYHASCLNQWLAQKPADARACPLKCDFRNVKCDKRRAGARTATYSSLSSTRSEPMPVLKLFLTDVGGTHAGAPSSSSFSSDAVFLPADAVADEARYEDEDDEVNPPPRPRKRLRSRAKGKARAVVEDDEEQEEGARLVLDGPHAAGPSGASGGGGDDDNDVRRQWMQAMATVREQRQEIERLNQLHSALLTRVVSLQAGTDDISEAGSDSDDEVRCLRNRERDDDDSDDDGGPDAYDSDEDAYMGGGGGATNCPCRRCNPERHARDRLRARVAELEGRLASEVEAAREREQALAANTSELSARIERLQVERAELRQEFNALSNDYQTDQVKWKEAKEAYEKKLAQSGESGAARIEHLRARLAEREREITHLKASIDGIRYRADQESKQAQAAAAQAQRAASAHAAQAEERARAAEARLLDEEKASKRYAAANAGLNQSIANLRRKLQTLPSKRGVVNSDSDAEDAAPSLPARAFDRTTSSRSILSPSPPADDNVWINNNSALLGNSPRKQRHARTALDDWDLSRDLGPSRSGLLDGGGDAVDGGGDEGGGDANSVNDDDDELEYVDVTTGVPSAKPKAASTAHAKPPAGRGEVIELSDDDDDYGNEPDVVASSYFRRGAAKDRGGGTGKGKGNAALLQLATSTSSRPKSQRSAAAEPFATLTNSLGGQEHPVWKKAAVASSSRSKQDKHLPDLSRGRVDTGAKRHVRRT